MDSMVKYGKPFAKIIGINNAGANGSVFKVVETKTRADKGYFVVGDIFEILPEKIAAMVKDVLAANGNETIAIRKLDGTKWRSSDITTSSKIKHEWYRVGFYTPLKNCKHKYEIFETGHKVCVLCRYMPKLKGA